MKHTFTQFLAPGLDVFAGKIDGLEADNNLFAPAWRTQFLNLGLTLNMAGSGRAHLGVGRRGRRATLEGRPDERQRARPERNAEPTTASMINGGLPP